MTGNSSRVVLGETDYRFLWALAEGDYLDRNHFRYISGRAQVSVSTTNVRLAKLLHAGVIQRFFIGTKEGASKTVYTLTKQGAEMIGAVAHKVRRSRASVLSDQFIHHQLAINSLVVAIKFRPLASSGVSFGRFERFQSVLSATIPLIPDGYFELNTATSLLCCFVEVDRGTEPQKVWRGKVSQYLQLAASGEFERRFSQRRFRVLVVTESARRLSEIRKTALEQTEKIFWFAELSAIECNGLLAAQWFRPSGDQPVSFLGKL